MRCSLFPVAGVFETVKNTALYHEIILILQEVILKKSALNSSQVAHIILSDWSGIKHGT